MMKLHLLNILVVTLVTTAGNGTAATAKLPLTTSSLAHSTQTTEYSFEDGEFLNWESAEFGSDAASAIMNVLGSGGNPGRHLRVTTHTPNDTWVVLAMWSLDAELDLADKSVVDSSHCLKFRCL